MTYFSSVHICEYESYPAYFMAMSSFIDTTVINYDRRTYTMAEQWPIIRKQVAEYKALRSKLFNLHSFEEIEDELNHNRFLISNAPVLSRPGGDSAFMDLRIFQRTWQYMQGFRAMEMSNTDLEVLVQEGWGWNLDIQVTVPTNPKPRFSPTRLTQALNSYGIFIHRAEFTSRTENGMPVYNFGGVMPAKLWRNLAMMEKLAGHIDGSIDFIMVD
jgi:hypothetical protein